MTTTQINEAIARAVGWNLATKKFDNEKFPIGFRWEYNGEPSCAGGGLHGWGWQSCKESADKYLPDYFNSLDAINQAERYAKEHLMDSNQLQELGIMLCSQRNDLNRTNYRDFATLIVELTAAQRAATLAKVLGLWTD